MKPAILCCAAVLALPGGPAFAHAQLVKADPRVGSTVTAAPARIWIA